MRDIVPKLTPQLENHFGGNQHVVKAKPFPVGSFEDLVREVAQLAHANEDWRLFFRGQGVDFKNKADASTFYPSIYRGDYLPREELRERFARLEQYGLQLGKLFEQQDLEGARDIKLRSVLQCSILQHYEVAETPLLDLTQSLAVASSFALDASKKGQRAYVYVFALPYVTNRISIHTEQEVVNVRLLSICPPDAIRPYFQEGYLAGTWDITDNYEVKSNLDFSRRLVAKFVFQDTATFWGDGFGRVPHSLLYPDEDRVREICDSISLEVRDRLGPETLGNFLLTWRELEKQIVDPVREYTERMVTMREAISRWQERELLPQDVALQLDGLRKWRNQIVHSTEEIHPDDIERVLAEARSLQELLSTIEWRNFS